MNDYLVTYEFQFHKVRLKACGRQRSVLSSHEFQFHKVRLKALRHFGYFFNFQFQFHKVRLKGY